jgi:tryptophan halogenase
MIQKVAVLGAGSAGLIAALTLKRMLPSVAVQVVRSPDIGVIGVGEGTTRSFPSFVFQNLRLDPAPFFREAEPIWKLGIRFLWGPRERFFYTFSTQFDYRWPDLPRNNGFYCADDMENVDVWNSLMGQGKAFPRGKNGLPFFDHHLYVGFHIENKKLVAWLEKTCRSVGVTFIDGTMQTAERSGENISALVLESGERITADLFVDASGFRSELLGQTLEEPYQSYDRALFCDRAVIGGWPRADEPILPYTTAETMEAGWCWQIEHEHWINRGYVYSSRFISDDDAREELVRKNPKVAEDGREQRIVKFSAGRYRRAWVSNVVAIGNASGFVEPLEATALATIITQSRSLAMVLFDGAFEPTSSAIAYYNTFIGGAWDEIRDFIALHYRFNKRIDSPFWRHCQAETELGNAKRLVDFYEDNGPSALHKTSMVSPDSSFSLEGYLALLVGQRVPHRKPYQPAAPEKQRWENHLAQHAMIARNGFTVAETLAAIRQPDWRWSGADSSPQ